MICTLHIIGSKKSGGAERFCVRLVGALHERGHPVRAVSPPGSEVAQQLGAEIPQTPVPMYGVWDLWSRWRIQRLVETYRPAIVQTYMGRATRLTHVKPAAAIHVARLGGYYNLKGYRHAHAWVGNTRGICDYLIKNGLPASKVFHIGNFVDTPAPATPEQLRALRAHWQIPGEALIVLSVGRLHPNKGFADLLEAFAALPETVHNRPLYLLIAGDGPLAGALKTRAAELGITPRTRWAGWQNDLSPFYQSANVFVSAARHEPLGNVILEAWAHGATVIATRTLGAEELIEHETSGLLTPCAQPEKLAQVILHLLEQDDDARRALIERGLQNIRTAYSKEAIVNAYIELYQRLAGER